MKLPLPVIAFLLSAAACMADTPISREDAGKIKTYNLTELTALMPEAEEKVVKLKFTYRGDTVEKQEDGSLHSVIRYLGRNGEGGGISVHVPKDAVSWFLKLPYEATSRQTLVVFAKITKDESGTFAELLGREIKTDIEGPKIIW